MVEMRMMWIRGDATGNRFQVARREETESASLIVLRGLNCDRAGSDAAHSAGSMGDERLPPDPCAQLVAWSSAAAPREACGFLFGIAREHRIDVCAVTCARNLAEGDDAFLLDPGDVARADRRARDIGLDLVGFWHSHPRAEAVPSASDERAAWPGLLCVIVAPSAQPVIRAWRSLAGHLHELNVESVIEARRET
jgi:proteasome lid subunit RPN8/RPN11